MPISPAIAALRKRGITRFIKAREYREESLPRRQKKFVLLREQPARAALHDQIHQSDIRVRVGIDCQRLLQQRVELFSVMLRNADSLGVRNQRAGLLSVRELDRAIEVFSRI